MRILVVEGNPDLLKILSELFRLWGHEVRQLSGEGSALAVALEFRPDVIILDLQLPDADSWEVARQMRRQPRLRDSFLIAISDASLETEVSRSLEAGFDIHLLKPLDFQGLKCLLKNKPQPAPRSKLGLLALVEAGPRLP